MLRDADLDDLYQGQIVYLSPHTKTASRACHEQRAVRVMHDKDVIRKHWPMVVVEWTVGGVAKWERVHRDNIKLRPKTVSTKSEKREGDAVGGGTTEQKWKRKLAVGRPVAVADEQLELF